VDAGLLAAAREWVATGSYEQERDYLAGHPELLDTSADDAVGEVLAALTDDAAQRYASLREAARAHGVEAAYQPVMLALLTHAFATSDLARQRAMLAGQRADLLSMTVRDGLTSRVDTPAGLRALALVDLAAQGEDQRVLTALDQPEEFRALLHSYACRAEVGPIDRAAELVLTRAVPRWQAAVVLLYLAVAAARAGDYEHATGLLGGARHLAPGEEDTWVGWLTEIGQHDDSVQPLLTQLKNPPEATGPP
jgi:hypothetical protein